MFCSPERDAHDPKCKAEWSVPELLGLGLDAESDEPLRDAFISYVLTGRERHWIRRQRRDDQGRLAKLVFSAKESVYKCQYPLTKRFLDFHQVELYIDAASSRYSAVVKTDRDLGDLRLFGSLPIRGRFIWRDSMVMTSAMIYRDDVHGGSHS
jgi:4'-phosphopantetheinyl transferase EntD